MSNVEVLPTEEKTTEEIREEEARLIGENPFNLVRHGFLTIKTKIKGIKKLYPNTVQKKFLDTIEKLFYSKKPLRVLVLKARQMGISTIIEAVIYAFVSRMRGINAFVIADDLEGANYIFEMQKMYQEYLGKYLKPRIKHSNEKKLAFAGLNSQILIDTADNPNIGRKFTIQFGHLCLAEENYIIVKDGFIKRISEIKKNDIVRTHRCKIANVKGLSKVNMQETFGNKDMLSIYINGNLHFPITCTPNHKIFVRNKTVDKYKFRGEWKEAKDLKTGDMVGFPYRPINNKQIEFFELFKRPVGHRSDLKWVEGKIYLNEDIGYVFGLYLAEGYINKSRICLGMHEKEKPILDNVGKILNQWITSYSIQTRKDSKTIVGNYYSVSLAKLFSELLGEKDNKHIPDFFWSCPREFLRGLIKGYLQGDGHIPEYEEIICVSSIRPQLLTQLRDLLVSFRYGYSSLDFRKGGFHYGRNCKDIWTLRIHGRTSANLRKEFGWNKISRTLLNNGRKRRIKGDWHQGTWHYWVTINKIEKTTRDTAYDIILDHKDHSYRTITGCGVHNSECSRFTKPLTEILSGLGHAVPNAAGTMVFLETTANGFEEFYDLWLMAKNGKSDWIPLFYAWHEFPEYALPLEGGMLYPIDNVKFAAPVEKENFLTDEKVIKERYGLTDEQLNWRRWDLVNNCSGDINKFNEDNPCCWEDAFVATGNLYFNREALKRQEIHKPIASGNIVRDEGYIFREDAAGLFKIYEFPRKGEQYVVGADSAEGLERGDKSAGIVINKRTNKTVCAYNYNTPPDRFEEDLIKMGSFYNMAVIACENKGYGYSVNQGLYKHYGKVYRRIKTKTGIKEPMLDLGWNTNSVSRPQMLAQLSEEITEGSTDLLDMDLINQCWTFINNMKRGQPEADRSKCDDLVIARAIAGQVRTEQPYKERIPLLVKRKHFRGLSGY